MSITSDGIFTIKAGQGLTQAIAAEIGISVTKEVATFCSE